MTDAARWKATVYVGGLAPLVTNTHVFDAFIPFGEIVEVQLPKSDAPNSTDPHKGFAYVEYEDSADAKEAIDNMDQSEFFGRVIKVSQAKAPKSADEGLGSKKAVWEQETWLAEHAAEEQGAEDRALQQEAPDPMQGLEGLDVAGPKLE
ncbi:Peptidyl-prolyl cis-trans isomerase E [Cladobotryum mycophilum]|uniref:Peptidyl-prolyl cis-trans isomerase E n=1 Tax=Cladobotryum mycophilum TaxID=491253 RepID=A0ABR0SY90_9HYPO